MENSFAITRGRFTIRPYQAADEAGILQCWQAVFHKEMPLSLWRWKYIHSPFGHQILLCLDEDDRYAALYGGIPFPFNWSGKRILMTHLMDNMSHPLYRGSGVFVRTAKAFFETYGGPHASIYMYGFPGSLHFEIGVDKLQYQHIPNGVRYLTAAVQEIQSPKRAPTGEIRPVDPGDVALNHLWAACRDHYPLSIIRDASFVSWRFGSHPEKNYHVLGYYPSSDGMLRAYAVLDATVETACLVDWLAPASLDDNVDFMLRIASFLTARGIVKLKTWLPADHFLTRAALSAGMKDTPEPLGFIPTVRVCASPFSFKWAGRNMYYTMADGDIF